MGDKSIVSGIFIGVILLIIGFTLIASQGSTVSDLSHPTTATNVTNETISQIVTNATNNLANGRVTTIRQVLGNQTVVIPAGHYQLIQSGTTSSLKYLTTVFNGSDINVSYTYGALTFGGTTAGTLYDLVDFVWAGVGVVFIVIGGFALAIMIKKEFD